MSSYNQSNEISAQPARVLITGAGLAAAYAAAALRARGAAVALYDPAPDCAYLGTVLDLEQVRVIEGDVSSLPELVAAAQEHRAGCILHSAALIGAAVSRHPQRGVEVNVGGSVNVVEAARLAGARRVVFCSSVAVYDLERMAAGHLIREDDPLGPKNLYGATKVAGEQLLDQYGRLYGLETVSLRLAGVLGRGQYTGGSWMGRKLNHALLEVLAGRPGVLQYEWLGIQEYIYARDAGRALALACLAPAPLSGAFNVGTGRLHSCHDIAAEIEQALPGARVRVVETGAPVLSYLQRTQAFDCGKIRERLGFTPEYSVQAGLAEYIDELRQHAGQYPVPA